MKKTIGGASILLSGSILFLSVCMASSSLGLKGGWNEKGRFLTAVLDNNLMPMMVLSILVMLGGFSMVLWGIFVTKGD